jgi:glycine cleavage system T protein (aminomethyltransferase)
MSDPTKPAARTPLHALHLAHGARIVPFAGYEMPLHYPTGILGEHLHTRAKAGLFDVSHMGQIRLRPHSGQVSDAARALERLVPADILGLPPGRQRYALFTNEAGGILDDLMVANTGDALVLVVNAACKQADLAHLVAAVSDCCAVEPLFDRALIALQGPAAEAALAALAPEAAAMRFMDVRALEIAGTDALVSRSGYTGEDGFEISVPAADAERIATLLLEQADVLPIGLGARDSLRLEAGLCLYGVDLDPLLTPVEAALDWSIGKSRKAGGARAGGFPGAPVILDQLANGPPRRRVGILPEGRAPLRAGTRLFADHDFGAEPVGQVTSGAFGPSLAAPVAMAMLAPALAIPGTALVAELRGRPIAARVAALPFVSPGFKRSPARTAA